MRKWSALLALLITAPEAPALAFTPSLPENPAAFSGCTAKVKVSAARLRAGPSLDARIMGVRHQDEPVYVRSVRGRWVQVSLPGGDTAFMAAYLLAFPFHDLLEQWKRETPSPSVGKKAKVKWASLRFRKYPSAGAPRLGGLVRGDEVAVLADAGAGWSLVEVLSEDGKPGCYGFVASRALAAPDAPDPPGWNAPLARVRRRPGEGLEPARESPAEHLARTAWSPDLFVASLRVRRVPDEGLRLASLD